MSCYSISHFKCNLNRILWSKLPPSYCRWLWLTKKSLKYNKEKSSTVTSNHFRQHYPCHVAPERSGHQLPLNCSCSSSPPNFMVETSFSPASARVQPLNRDPQLIAPMQMCGESCRKMRPTTFYGASIDIKMVKDCHLPIITLSNFLYSINLKILENCQHCLIVCNAGLL